MRKIVITIIVSLFLSNLAYTAETILYCKFKYGDRTAPGTKETYGPGDIKDEYLKIDFDREKIISAPHYTGNFSSSVVFGNAELKWLGKKEGVYNYFAELNRHTGRLIIIWNQYPFKPERWSTQYNYSCSSANLKF